MKAEWTNRDNLSIETTSQNSKAVLVIDMPRNCWGCPCNEVDSDGMSWCNALAKNTIHSNVERQPWCPLKPLPKEEEKPIKGEDDYNDFCIGYTRGWNECLEEITE